MWIVDFACDVPESAAAQYERPFELVEHRVKPGRQKNRRDAYAKRWWIHVEPRPSMRAAIGLLTRFIVTCRVAKHRLFLWFDGLTLPDSATFCFAREDDYFFGVLHSSLHEMWALRQGTHLETRPRYTPTTSFETFPLPWPPGGEPAGDSLYLRIADAAIALNAQRQRWLDPPELLERIARHIDAREDFRDVPEAARAPIRHSAIMAEAARDKDLKKRTLTNLYNERPMWLKLAHRRLDEAVLAAYGAVDPGGGWSEQWAEVWQDSGAGQPLPEGHPLTGTRAAVDEKVLSNLLRLNKMRSGTATSRP
jgi:hypothetical protein